MQIASANNANMAYPLSSTTESEQEQTRPQSVDSGNNPEELTGREKLEIEELKKRDKEIKEHEDSHARAAGVYLRKGATFEYKRGPDGKAYAVHGDVSVDTAKALDPRDSIRKMRVVRKAALAPVSPSPQDMKIAGKVLRTIAEETQRLRLDKLQELTDKKKEIEKRLEKASPDKESTQSAAVSLDEDDKGVVAESTPEKDGGTSAMKKITVNSVEKYTVNIAQYQYASLEVVV